MVLDLDDGSRITLRRERCPEVDTDKLIEAVGLARHDVKCVYGWSPPIDVLVTMRGTLGANGLYHGNGRISLKCGKEHVLRHELHHHLCNVMHWPCDCSKVSRPDLPGHPLGLNCRPRG